MLEAAYLEKLSELAPSPDSCGSSARSCSTPTRLARPTRSTRRSNSIAVSCSSTSERRGFEEAYLYEQAIDRDTYAGRSDRLSEERALLQLGRHGAEIEGLDVETLLNYAEYLALNSARLWQEAGPEQKARLQVFLVPSGLTWDGERFGTVESGLFFSRLAGFLERRGEDGSSVGSNLRPSG